MEDDSEINETMRWIRVVRGLEEDPGGVLDGLDDFLKTYGYASLDAGHMSWLCAAVLLKRGALDIYVKENDGDLSDELDASMKDAQAAMNGDDPTHLTYRHDLYNTDFRSPYRDHKK